jgi:hypothetical protein
VTRQRDDFNAPTRRIIGQRAGWLCSFPTCRAPTEGATSDTDTRMSLGMASHICAAAEGGPRYDPSMTPQERSSVANGMWTCRNHGTAIDSADSEYTIELLRRWKREAETYARQRVLDGAVQAITKITPAAADLRQAVRQDMEMLRRTDRWPATEVELTVRFEEEREPTPTKALAKTLVPLGDLLLVAAPGMGKTTALLQIYQEMLASECGLPIFVPLADWATGFRNLLDSILHRASFQGVTEAQLRAAAAEPGVVLMLDGWNELDQTARQRARVQLRTLKAELPLMGLIISTRRQAVNVPVDAVRVDLQPLSYRQQAEIARQLHGEPGARLVDEAWRTPGVRELVSMPLYLTALLSLPSGAVFPGTKEALLRHFVVAHEKKPEHAEALRAVLGGLHDYYLRGLAVRAMRAQTVALSDTDARRSVVATGTWLESDGQLVSRHDPQNTLDVLVSSHALMRAADTEGYLFQHQQIQEWFASHYVEERILAAPSDAQQRQDLQRQILDMTSWEEAVLFAVERLANSAEGAHTPACAHLVMAALEVDPLLAAEMIYRSTDAIWAKIEGPIQKFVRSWHTGGADRALRFMLTSGRPEFFDLVWPLVTHEDDQVSFRALRNCRRFRTSVLGVDAARDIAALPFRIREVLLTAIASHGDVEAMDLVTKLAKADADVAIKESVLNSLAFRRADLHVTEILRDADEATIDRLATSPAFDMVDVKDAVCHERLLQAKQRVRRTETDHDRIARIAKSPQNPAHEPVLLDLLSHIDLEGDRGVDGTLYELRLAYGAVVAQAIIARILAGRPLFYQAADIISEARLVSDDPALLQLARENLEGYHPANQIAASVLGPISVAALFDEIFALEPRRKVNGEWNRDVTGPFYDLLRRLALARAEILLEAILARTQHASTGQMELMADVLVRRRGKHSGHDSPYPERMRVQVVALVIDWGERMLAAGDASREQIASIAQLAECAPSPEWLPVLQRLLNDNLQRLLAFRAQAHAQHWRPGRATQEARHPHTHEYARALAELDHPDARRMLFAYLTDVQFGSEAATVMVNKWRNIHEPQPSDLRYSIRPDFSFIQTRRAALQAASERSCEEADALFAAITQLLAEEPTDTRQERQSLAVSLGLQAVRMPHGPWRDPIPRLLTLTPHRSRSTLLLHLGLSGHLLPLAEVARGITDTIAAAQSNVWTMMQQEAYEIRQWLQVLPLTDEPLRALELIQTLPV